MMPGMDGEVLKRLREGSLYACFVLTAKTEIDQRVEGPGCGRG